MQRIDSVYDKIFKRTSYFVNNQRGLFLAGLFTSTVFWTTSLAVCACKGETAGMYISMIAEFVLAAAYFMMLFVLTERNPGGFNGPQDFIPKGISKEEFAEQTIKVYRTLQAQDKSPQEESPGDKLLASEELLINHENQLIKIKEETIDILMSSKKKVRIALETNRGSSDFNTADLLDRELYNDLINIIAGLTTKYNQLDFSIEKEDNNYKHYPLFRHNSINSNFSISSFRKHSGDFSVVMDVGCNTNSEVNPYYNGLVVSDQENCILN